MYLENERDRMMTRKEVILKMNEVFKNAQNYPFPEGGTYSGIIAALAYAEVVGWGLRSREPSEKAEAERRGAERMRERAARAAEHAQTPKGFRWDAGPLDLFITGKFQAAAAIRALPLEE